MNLRFKRILRNILGTVIVLYSIFVIIPNYKVLYNSSSFVAILIACIVCILKTLSPTGWDKKIFEDIPLLPKIYFWGFFLFPFIYAGYIIYCS